MTNQGVSKDLFDQRPITKTRFRLLTAYGVTTRIIISIGVFHLMGKLLGKEWTERRIARKYGAAARKLKVAILQLKGLFIKVGQMISIMSNFLPEYFRNELEELQDQIPPQPLSEVADRFQNDFGKTTEELFASFEQIPFASASLAQVHKAILPDGRQVAVKVQYTNIEKIAHKDLKTIRRLIGIVGFFLRVKGLSASFDQVQEMILEELDFKKEASNINEIATNFKGDPEVGFPTVVEEFSSDRVLTTEFVEGIKISDIEKLDAIGVDRTALTERVLIAYCKMIFSDGIYHADPHPGNILVQPTGKIIFLDFGAVAKLSKDMKEGIPQFLEGCLRRDKNKIIGSLDRMGFIAFNKDRYNVEIIIDYVYQRFLDSINIDAFSLKDIHFDASMKMEMMADIRKLDISLLDLSTTVSIPKDWILLERVILLLMGLCTCLDPSLNPIKIIRPYLEEFVLGNDRKWMNLVTSVVKDTVRSALTIPEDLKKVLTLTKNGELEIKVKNLKESTNLIYALGHQLLYALFTIASGGLCYVASIRGEELLMNVMGGICGFFGLAFGISILSNRHRQKSR